MTQEEKLSKAVKLADAMYYAAQMLSLMLPISERQQKIGGNLKMLNLTRRNRL